MAEFTTGWGYSGFAEDVASTWDELYGKRNADMLRALPVESWPAGLPRVEPCELEYPECGYELDVSAAGVFTMRTAERVCLGVYLEGRLVEVQGPVQS